MSKGIIRFAPSPTGYLHEGHLLSALYVWAAAKKWDLQIHMRIEDHDRGRTREAYVNGIREDLAWLGFKYDFESIQSGREEIYQAALEKLKAQGLIYPCTCSRKQLEQENPKSETGEIMYQGKCRVFKDQDWTSLPPHNLRFITEDREICWKDLRLGEFRENPSRQCGDFPLRDREGCWTYQFAVCVDDTDQGITHVVRGEDLRNSTARQILLMEALGRKTPPIYLHHPLITDPTGKKLSKREHAHSLRSDKEAGFTPEMLLGRVCFKANLQPENNPISLDEAISLVASKL